MKQRRFIRWFSFALLACLLCMGFPAGAQEPGARADRELSVHGFTAVEKRFLENSGAWVYYLKHTKTGAAVIFEDNGSVNLQFGIGFASSATNDAGANHVLEHALLGGSEKYPSKNLFYNLGGNTAASFLNAFTGDDSVVYPFETRYQKDYQNLLDVYLSLVFQPMLAQDKNIFLREGVRREYVDGQARYNGVVYNEMRARGGLADECMMQAYKQLYPNCVPGFDSGGSPANIPSLTYEEVMDVYRTNYNAANSITYLAGDIDLDQTLAVMDSYFKNSQGGKPEQTYGAKPTAPSQPLLRLKSTQYDDDASILSMVYTGLPATNPKDTAAAELLYGQLATEAMLHFGDGNVMFTSTKGGGQNTMGLLFYGVQPGQEEAHVKVVEDLCRGLKDLSQEKLLELIDKNEQSKLENKMFQITLSNIQDGYLYAEDPYAYLDSASLYQQLRDEVGSGYFADMVDSYFLNNPYRSVVYMQPADQPSAENTISATPEEIETIKQEMAAFETWANTPEPPEVANKLPKLSMDDFREAPFHFDVSQSKIGSVPYAYSKSSASSDKTTAAFHFSLDALDLSQVPAAQLIADLIGAKLREKGAGNVYANVWSNAEEYDGNKINPTMNFTAYCKPGELVQTIQTINEVLQDNSIFTAEAIRNQLPMTRASAKMNAEMYFTYDILNSSLTKGNQFNQYASGNSNTQGYEYYQYLRGLPDAEAAAADIAAVLPLLVTRSNLLLSFQGSEADSKAFQSAVAPILDRLPITPLSSVEKLLPEGKRSFAIIDSGDSKVAAIYQAGSLQEAGIPYSGAMQVLAKVVETAYLYPQIRSAGGAYGAQMHVDSAGYLYVSAGRAPNIPQALNAFQGIGGFLRQLTLTQSDLNNYIISAISEFDSTYLDWSNDFGGDSVLKNVSMDDLLRERSEILSATPQQLRSYADLMDKVIAQNRIMISASRAMVDSSGFTPEETLYPDQLFAENTSGTTAQHKSYMQGNGDGTFEPDRPLTRAQAAAVLARVLTVSTGDVQPLPFTDTPADSWYLEAVGRMVEMGVMQGNGDGTFRPDDTITGEEFALMAARIREEPLSVPVPQGAITRADAVRIVNDLLGRKADGKSIQGVDVPAFSDVPTDHPAYYDILEATVPHEYKTAEDGGETWLTVR